MLARDKGILVTGGAGYIGSHMSHLLKNKGYFPIIIDNLSSGTKEAIKGMAFYEGDAGDEKLIQEIHNKFHFSSIIHFAGSIQVGESVNKPLKYYNNNVGATLNILKMMEKLEVKNIVFSSSASVYGEPESNSAVTENHSKFPLSPYGKSKWIVEQILQDLNRANKIQAICLRYFNVAGANSNIYAGKRTIAPTNLVPIALQAILLEKPVTIFGNDYNTKDGTCIRDYIHVMDLCEAHLLALEFLIRESDKDRCISLNLGTNIGYSVLEIVKAAELITNKKVNIVYGSRRLGDPEFLIADGNLAKTMLNWQPNRSDLLTIIEDAWKYELKRNAIFC